MPTAKVSARKSERAARPRGGQRQGAAAHTSALGPHCKVEHRSRLLSIRQGQRTHGGECLRLHLTHRSSGRPEGRRLPQTLGASNAIELRTAQAPSSSRRWRGFKARTVAFSGPRVLRRSARAISYAAVNFHRWRRQSVLWRPAQGFRSFAVRCALRRRGASSIALLVKVSAGCLSFGSQREVGFCAGASFNGSVPKRSGVCCEGWAQSGAARACFTGLVQRKLRLLNRRWQTHGRECQSIHRVRFGKCST